MRTGKRTKRLSGVLVASAAVLVASLAVPASSAAAAPASSSVAAASSAAPSKEPSHAQWKKLDALSKSHHALGFYDSEGDASQVLALPAGTSADEKAKVKAAIPAGTDITVKTSQFTKDALAKIDKAVMDRKWHRDALTYGVATTYDEQTDKMLVKTDAPLSDLDSLRDAYPGQLEVRNARLEPQDNRFNEASPFNGGTAMTGSGPGSGWCTSAFGVKNGNVPAMVTAAHCGPIGTHWYARRADGSTGNWMGQVAYRDPNTDVEMIVANGGAGVRPYDWHLWSGGNSSSTSTVFVKSWLYANTGKKVCVSGVMSYNHCGHPISNTNYSVCWNNGVCIKNGRGFLYDRGGSNAPYYNNGKLTVAGDSGAPVYEIDNTGSAAWIVGVHSGLIADACCTPHMVAAKWSSFPWSSYQLITDTNH